MSDVTEGNGQVVGSFVPDDEGSSGVLINGPSQLYGPPPTITVSASTLAEGAAATATVSGSDGLYNIALGIPVGATGSPPMITSGSVTTLAPGSAATASVTGTAPNYVLNLGIPRGDPGAGDMSSAANLSDLADVIVARANLGLGSLATQSAAAVAITGGTIAGITDLAIADGGTGASTASVARTNLGLGTAALLDSDNDNALVANSATKLATQQAVKAYIDSKVASLLKNKGNLDCSANPNYPAGTNGDAYYVSVAGKVGGASGKSVDVGDVVVCKATNAGGTEAAVGASWYVLQANLVGALQAGNNLSDVGNTATALANLGGQSTALPYATPASTTTTAGLKIPPGTAPTAPANGDVWTTSAGMFVRINGTTVGPLAAAGGGSIVGTKYPFTVLFLSADLVYYYWRNDTGATRTVKINAQSINSAGNLAYNRVSTAGATTAGPNYTVGLTAVDVATGISVTAGESLQLYTNSPAANRTWGVIEVTA